MRRSSAEIRRAIEGERKAFESEETPLMMPRSAIQDVLRWCLGERGTAFEKIVKLRARASVLKMPGATAAGKGGPV